MKDLLLALLLSGPLFASCTESVEIADSWTLLPLAELNVAQEAQLARAMTAKDDLFSQLSGTLSSEVAASGPASAIGVCREQAPLIAAEVSERAGLRIGRTSHKLRNPENAAPAWAEELLAELTEEPRAILGPEDQLGVVLPIHLQAQCLACHGSAETIPADVREALATLYPEDRATGFAEGDLRGWFWVEVPGEAR